MYTLSHKKVALCFLPITSPNMLTHFKILSLLERVWNFPQNMYKNFKFPHTLNVLLLYLVICKMFENDTKYAEITVKSHHAKAPHVFSHLLTLLQNLLKVSLFKLPTSSQMCVPLVNCQESSLFSTRTAFFWYDIEQNIIDSAISEWRNSL